MIVGSNILAGASGQQGYFLNRSVRTRSSASAYFNRTNGTPTSATTWTWSGWVKRGVFGTQNNLAGAGQTSGTNYTGFVFNADNTFQVNEQAAGSNFILQTTQVFRDPSSWYHIIVAVDTTQATASNRIKLYINGVQVTAFSTATYPTLNYVTFFNSASYVKALGNIWYNGGPGGFYFDGYSTEINFIDGQALTPTSFGEFNTITGVWQPKKYGGTYGTNGFYLNFNDNSAATAAAIGKDSSGNGNNWTPNNISVTAGVTYDSMTDVPTLTSATNANFPVMNVLIPAKLSGTATRSVTNGNLTGVATGGNGWSAVGSTMVMPSGSGKWYCEVTYTTANDSIIGIHRTLTTATFPSEIIGYTGDADGYSYGASSGSKFNNNTGTAYGATWTTGDVIGIALDMSTAGSASLTFYKNNISQGVAFSGLSGDFMFAFSATNSAVINVNFGQRPFTYTPPTGFNRLNTYNLPTPTIANGANYMNAIPNSGTGTTRTDVVAFQPDLVWTKTRNTATNGFNIVQDSVRGAGNRLITDGTYAEAYDVNYGSFNSTGFTFGSNLNVNTNGNSYIDWFWKAGGTAVTNTSGTISSQVSANPSAGFSIVTWTGNGVSSATVGHGLGIQPAMVILKSRSLVNDWWVAHKGIPNSWLQLETTGAASTGGGTNGTINYQSTFTSNVFGFLAGSSSVNNVNQNAATYVAYCFSEIAGYSKFGSYTGNGSTDGPFVYLGFRPRFILAKRTSAVSDWWLYDTSRNTYNVISTPLFANLSNAEGNNAVYNLDLLSNGFKWRTADTTMNGSGSTYIYAAFAENPFNYSLAR